MIHPIIFTRTRMSVAWGEEPAPVWLTRLAAGPARPQSKQHASFLETKLVELEAVRGRPAPLFVSFFSVSASPFFFVFCGGGPTSKPSSSCGGWSMGLQAMEQAKQQHVATLERELSEVRVHTHTYHLRRRCCDITIGAMD
eukprot:COSAG01_NODE_10188_length_2226_cov_1.527726_1_plen_141_part_00